MRSQIWKVQYAGPSPIHNLLCRAFQASDWPTLHLSRCITSPSTFFFLACIIWTENGYRFSSIERKVKCFSIHLQEGYETFHAPTWGLWDKPGFFFEVCDVADNQPDDLARSGYILKLIIKYVDLHLFSSKPGEFGPFFPWKIRSI